LAEYEQGIKGFEKSDKKAVVFGLFETGLGVIRSLGRKGIKIVGVDYKRDIGWYSRYVTPLLCPNPVTNRQEFITWVMVKFADFKNALPAFITGDDFLNVLSEERERFCKILILNLPTDDLLKTVADKYSQYTLAMDAGINVPKTWLLESAESLNKLQHHSEWPLIIKGRNVNSWRTVFGGNIKGFVVKDYHELEEKVKKAVDTHVPVIAQEIIKGNDSNHFKYCAYISESGQTLAEFCLRKIRQWPIRFGVGSVVESIEDDELLAVGRQFFKKIGYRGVGSAEFKRDAQDNCLKLIELNARYWQQNALAEACEVNFARINYLDLMNKRPTPVTKYQTGIKWINRYMDFSSFLAYHREGELSVRAWQKSLRGKKVYADFSWDDPIPVLYEIGFGKKLVRLPAFLWKRIVN
jgi:D-aspartate ligase